ncbi:hypothetical protein [Paraflavitalea speifideaquila]|uniref:hypothetical protein n=1 Tax=Paraflavitalea speifideaquila TaxID=3076558 RepID=UPI0028E60508|nr:hypothetical protein [Paraflavitalea speifideiaquila]
MISKVRGNPAAYGNYNPVFVLKKIENLFGDKIEFFYTKEFYIYRSSDKEVYTKIPNPGLNCNYNGDGFEPLKHKSIYNDACDSRLDSIVTTSGDKIVFGYSGRNDLAGASKLNTIIRYYKTASSQTFIASFKLNNSYFGSGTNSRELRLKLDGVEQVDTANQTLKSYSFVYNTANLPSRISAAQDSLGFSMAK